MINILLKRYEEENIKISNKNETKV